MSGARVGSLHDAPAAVGTVGGASWCVASVPGRIPKHLPSVPRDVIAIRLGI